MNKLHCLKNKNYFPSKYISIEMEMVEKSSKNESENWNETKNDQLFTPKNFFSYTRFFMAADQLCRLAKQ